MGEDLKLWIAMSSLESFIKAKGSDKMMLKPFLKTLSLKQEQW
jgi:hypothetical protein